MTTNSSSAPSFASRLPQIICHFASHRRALILPLVLAAIVWMALLSRIDFFVIEGGLKADQANWARGGITSGYLTMTFLVGVLSILMGILAEMMVRTYFESSGRRSYSVRETVNFPAG